MFHLIHRAEFGTNLGRENLGRLHLCCLILGLLRPVLPEAQTTHDSLLLQFRTKRVRHGEYGSTRGRYESYGSSVSQW